MYIDIFDFGLRTKTGTNAQNKARYMPSIVVPDMDAASPAGIEFLSWVELGWVSW